jgi:prolipoprotein diacylglyceryl transferase
MLASIPSPSTSVLAKIGPIPIRAYALCIILGIIAACWITEVRMRRRGAPTYFVLDVAVYAVPAGIIGARLYSLATSPQEYFGHGLSWYEPFLIWHGGLGIWGAVSGGAVGAWLACRQRGVPLSFVADALAPGLPVAQAIGRFGNWFNNELYGRPTTLPWGLQVHQQMDANGHAVLGPDGKPALLPGLYQPTFLYEAVWDLGVALLVWLLDRRYRFGRGRAFALYVMAYTVGRAWIEYLRVDQANHFLGLRINDWVSLVVFIGALTYFTRIRGPRARLQVAADGTITVLTDGAAATNEDAAGGAAEAGSDSAAGPPATSPPSAAGPPSALDPPSAPGPEPSAEATTPGAGAAPPGGSADDPPDEASAQEQATTAAES